MLNTQLSLDLETIFSFVFIRLSSALFPSLSLYDNQLGEEPKKAGRRVTITEPGLCSKTQPQARSTASESILKIDEYIIFQTSPPSSVFIYLINLQQHGVTFK